MKIKNNIKRILSIVVSMMVMASLFTVTAFAAPTTTSGTIDTTKKGSLEIVKYEGNDTTKPLADVTFTYKKIADIEQIVDGTTNTIAYSVDDSFKTAISLGGADYTIKGNAYYKAETIQDALKAASYETMKAYAKANGINMDVTNGEGKSTVTDLDLGLYVVVETAYPSKVTQPSSPFLVSLPSTVGTIDGNSPFTDNLAESTTAKAQKWIYDITARPKNSTSTLEIDKGIITSEGNNADGIVDDIVKEKADYNIGDTVKFRIKSDVPATITKLKTYNIVDTLTYGLTYKSIEKVYGVTENGTVTILKEAKKDEAGNYVTTGEGENKVYADLDDGLKPDYIVTKTQVKDKNGKDVDCVTVKFIRRGAMGDYAQVYVDLVTELNTNAVIGNPGNPNHADLYYSNEATDENNPETPDKPGTPDEPGTPETPETPETPSKVTKVPAQDPVVYTYEIDVTKYLDSVTDGEKASGIEFELQDKDEKAIKVKKVGDYYFKDNSEEATNTTLTTGTDGKILIKGLDAGTYYLQETKTKDGYNLLKDKITVEIKSEIEYSKNNTEGTLIKIEDNKNYCVVNHKNPKTYSTLTYEDTQLIIDGEDKYLKVGTVKVYTYTNIKDNTDGTKTFEGVSEAPVDKYLETLTFDEPTYGMTNGVVNLNVVNKKGFDLPTTGGMGTWLFTIGGLILMAGAVVLFAKSKKSTEK